MKKLVARLILVVLGIVVIGVICWALYTPWWGPAIILSSAVACITIWAVKNLGG